MWIVVISSTCNYVVYISGMDTWTVEYIECD